jgi:predicted alpha/beta hydrolase family esterase
MDKKVIFVHGYTASSSGDWYPNISRELDKLRIDYSIPDFPGGKYPHSKEWLEILDREVRTTEKPIVLVGHSLGTRTILLYLDKADKSFDAVILISPPDNNVERGRKRADGKLIDFWEYAIVLENLRAKSKRFIVMHSKDDPVCDYYEGGVDIASRLNAELITLDGRGHMSEPENYKYVLKVFKKIL